MQIDWFTFFAQIVNFLIVLYLLRRFLYTPILRAMRDREAKIAAQFEEAERQMRHVQQEGDLLRSQRQELEARRQESLANAEREAAQRRRTLILEARQEVGEMQERWYAAIEHEKQLFLESVRTRLSEQIFQIARRALSDLANVDLEKAIIGVFLQRLQAPASSTSGQEEAEEKSATQTVIVRTTFDLPPPLQQQVVESLQDLLLEPAADPARVADHLRVHFTQAPDLICGIEAQVRDRRIAWTLRDYLDGLEEALVNALRKEGTEGESDAALAEVDLAADGILPA